jgi:RNA polymerase sigma-70 factor (ECF subfamily)
MHDTDWLAARFEENRTHLRAVAYRMLGSPALADDAVQDTWLRFSGADTSGVENVGGWLTTVIARVCLDRLRSRASRREDPLDAGAPEPAADDDDDANPEREALLSDSIGVALLVVLDALAPAERIAFVLHDMFDLSFDEIAPVVGRTPAAARQLASRARRRVQGRRRVGDSDRARRREMVDAFLAASRGGNFDALLAVLDPDVVVRGDAAAVTLGGPNEVRGPADVLKTFAGRARGAKPALVNGVPGAVWAPGGRPRVVFVFTFGHGAIAAIDLVADPDRLREIDLVIMAG